MIPPDYVNAIEKLPSGKGWYFNFYYISNAQGEKSLFSTIKGQEVTVFGPDSRFGPHTIDISLKYFLQHIPEWMYQEYLKLMIKNI